MTHFDLPIDKVSHPHNTSVLAPLSGPQIPTEVQY